MDTNPESAISGNQCRLVFRAEGVPTAFDRAKDRIRKNPSGSERIAIYPPVGRRGIDRLLNFVAGRGDGSVCADSIRAVRRRLDVTDPLDFLQLSQQCLLLIDNEQMGELSFELQFCFNEQTSRILLPPTKAPTDSPIM